MKMIRRIRSRVLSFNINQEIDFSKKYYSVGSIKDKVTPMAISCLDGRTVTTGLSDRINGMITVFAWSKVANIPFRIEHVAPFMLHEYLVPNQYDWILKDGEKSFNLLYANPVFLRATSFSRIKGKRLLWLKKNRQYHFYTNANFLGIINKRWHTDFKFGELYRELFRPSNLLLEYISKYRAELGDDYISISFRFMQLMGDFKDCYGDELSESEKITLVKKCKEEIAKVHSKNGNKKVLVTSDSSTFIEEAKKLEYVYVIPGEIGHIGYAKGEDVHLKTFLDFYMISQARHAYMAHSGKMYRSNFARTAAATNDVPYDEIVF